MEETKQGGRLQGKGKGWERRRGQERGGESNAQQKGGAACRSRLGPAPLCMVPNRTLAPKLQSQTESPPCSVRLGDPLPAKAGRGGHCPGQGPVRRLLRG